MLLAGEQAGSHQGYTGKSQSQQDTKTETTLWSHRAGWTINM